MFVHLHLSPEVPQSVHRQSDLLRVAELPDPTEESEESRSDQIEVGRLDGSRGNRTLVVALCRLGHVLRLETWGFGVERRDRYEGEFVTCENVDKLTEAGQVVVSEVIFKYRPTIVEQKNTWQRHHSELSVHRVILVAVEGVKPRENQIKIL